MDEFFQSIEGKSVLITGSSRGIGKAMAIAFAKCGAKVILHGTKETDALKDTYSEIKRITDDVFITTADLSCDESPQKIYSDAVKFCGGVDILICNASLQIRNSWRNVSAEEASLQLKINFVSVMRLIQLCSAEMISKKWGRIITVGSVQQVKPHPDMLVYSASKAALVNMIESLSLQVAENNITVNNIAPGTIHTDRNTKVLSDKEYLEKVRNDIPLKFIGEPYDCAGIALLLASDYGRYITGENIFVDGGKHI